MFCTVCFLQTKFRRHNSACCRILQRTKKVHQGSVGITKQLLRADYCHYILARLRRRHTRGERQRRDSAPCVALPLFRVCEKKTPPRLHRDAVCAIWLFVSLCTSATQRTLFALLISQNVLRANVNLPRNGTEICASLNYKNRYEKLSKNSNHRQILKGDFLFCL